MATRKNTFLLKRSNVPGKVPLPGDLRLGELALNTADVILYTSGTTKNQIIPIGWDRIHRTGDTVTGDFVFYGDISISGSSLPNGYALSVTGDTNITNNLYVGNTITATTIGTSGNCIDDIYVSNIHSCSPLNINPLDEGNVYFGSTSGVTFDLTNKKVGIGTSTPSTLLHVVGSYTGGTDALIPQMLFQNSNTIPNTNKTAIIRTTVGTGYVAGYPEIWLESQQTSTGVGLTKLRTVSNHPLLFYTNDIERARFGETGNFGINTPSPVGKLHVRTGVNKNIIFTSGSTRNLIRSLIDGNSNYVGLEIDTLDLNIKTNGVDRMIINSSGNTGIGTTSPTAKLHINNTTSGNTFLAEDNTNPDSTPFVIDASGNTGIGIVTPTVKLHLSGNSIFEQSKLTINQKDSIVGIDIVNSGESMYQLSNSITDWCIVGKTPSEFYFYNSLNVPIRFYTNASEKMTVLGNGNVGIGITSPTAKFHINNTTSGNTFLAEDNTNPDSTPFVIDANGNTGIGTLTPISKLQVVGQTTLVQPQNSDYIVFSSSTLVNSGQKMFIRQIASNQYSFATTGIGTFMRVGPTNLVDFSNQSIQTNGSATFGTIRPLQPNILNLNEIPSGITAGTQDYRGVLVNPTVNFGGTYSGNFIGYLHNPTITSMANGRHIAMQIVSGDVLLNTTSGNVGIGLTGTTAKLHINNTTSGNTFLAEDNTNPDSTPFVIDASGNVGIGTLTPNAKLDVRGDTIISSGLTATTINVPPLADDKIVYTTNNGRLTTTSAFTYNQSNNTFSVNNINANGSFNITGNTTQSGTTNQLGNFNITGNTIQFGGVTLSGNTFITGNTDQVGNVNITGNTVIDGSLSADTVTITNTPTLNNTLFQILGRNETTGDVEYRQVNTIGNNVTILTGGTYSAQTTIDNVIGVDTSLTTTTIYLPDSVSSGRLRFEIKDIGLNAYNNPITIIAAGTDTIISYTNSQTLIMESEGGAIILFNTGLGQWWQM